MENEVYTLPLVETFVSLQGEGYHTGKAAFFIRLAGCDVACRFCDTQESWNAKLYPQVPISEIVKQALEAKLKDVIITGGEPLKWDLAPLTQKLHEYGFTIYLETSGTEQLKGEYNWICCSPKLGHFIYPEFFQKANELKIIVTEDKDLDYALEMQKKFHPGCHLFLQPEWSKRSAVLPMIVNFILSHPEWRLSLQTHKYINIP